MNLPASRSAIVAVHEDDSPASRLRGIVRKSALLNVVVVLTSFPVLVLAGGPGAVVPTLAIMAGISVVIWATTIALFSCVSVGRLVWMTFSSGIRRKPPVAANRVGVADRWLDGPG